MELIFLFSQRIYKKLIVEGKEPTPLYNNCSGKHTGMLITAKHMEESLENYYALEHPVQQRNLQVMAEVADYAKEKIGIGTDGCGVPVFAMPLERLAYAFARMADPVKLGEKRASVVERITSSMTAHPEMVAGTDRFCTDFMRVGEGRFFGKLGAESVYCLGDKETGIGIAIKIEDGDYTRGLYPAVVEVLKQLKLLTKEQINQLENYYKIKLKNARQDVIGEVIPSFILQESS